VFQHRVCFVSNIKFYLFSFLVFIFMALSSFIGSDSVTTLKEPVINATPTEKSSVFIDWNSPTKKSKMEGKGKVTNGRVNAFEIMMERSRVGTRKNMKQRSLFQ
jgi:hypothetical protein